MLEHFQPHLHRYQSRLFSILIKFLLRIFSIATRKNWAKIRGKKHTQKLAKIMKAKGKKKEKQISKLCLLNTHKWEKQKFIYIFLVITKFFIKNTLMMSFIHRKQKERINVTKMKITKQWKNKKNSTYLNKCYYSTNNTLYICFFFF